MKNGLIIAGVILIILSVVGFAKGGFSITENKTVLDVGPIKVDSQVEKRYPIPPLVNYALLAGGAALVIGGAVAKPA